VPARSLPSNPSLENLRKQAKTLRYAVRYGDGDAIELVREFHPQRDEGLAGFALASAQLVIARWYGFRSWRRLREHLAVVSRYARSPYPQPAGAQDPADEFLRLACLTYGTADGADDVRRHARAREMLAAHPDWPAPASTRLLRPAMWQLPARCWPPTRRGRTATAARTAGRRRSTWRSRA
jgi:hypothetical protein